MRGLPLILILLLPASPVQAKPQVTVDQAEGGVIRVAADDPVAGEPLHVVRKGGTMLLHSETRSRPDSRVPAVIGPAIMQYQITRQFYASAAEIFRRSTAHIRPDALAAK